MKLSDKIALLRRQKGLSQEQFAEIVEVSRQAVYKWETGASTPDLDKIKKMSSFFGISFDLLLDDRKSINTDCQPGDEPRPAAPAAAPKPTPPRPKRRQVLHTNRKLPSDYADLCHGYTQGVHKKVDESDAYYARLNRQMNQLTQSASYETLPLQKDIPACFFVDNAAKVCGIIFYGCEQFVCPFENIVDMTISTDGQRLDYSGRSTMVGVGPNSFMVGRMPQAEMMNPTVFNVNIVYLSETLMTKDYRFTLFSNGRIYIAHDGTADSLEKLAFHSNLMSAATMKYLTDIRAKIQAIKEIGAMIRSGAIEVPPIDTEKYQKRQENALAAEKENDKLRNDMVEKAKRQYAIGLIIKIGLAAIAVALLIYIFIKCSH